MGDVHRAVGTGNDAIFRNPAGMSLFPRYVVESFWRRHAGRNETLTSLSVLDSRTGPVAGGLAYTYDYAGSSGGIRSGSRFDVATSYAMADWLLAGTSLRYLHMDTVDAPVRRVTGDAGFIFRLGDRINLGVVGQNYFNATDAGRVAPRVLGVGFGAVVWKGLVVGFDYDVEPEDDEQPARYSAGAEFFFLDHFALRGGWTSDEIRDDRHVSVGGSFVDEEYGLDVSFGRSIAGAPGYELSIGLRVFVN